jgi:hypothetical protein
VLSGVGACSPVADSCNPEEVQMSCQGVEVFPAIPDIDTKPGASTDSRIAKLAIHAWMRRRVGFIF